MARESRIPEVDEPVEVLSPPTQSVAPTMEYHSSEQLQQRNRDVFASEQAKKNKDKNRTEKDKIHKVLDQYIEKHSKTSEVRKMAQEGERTAEAQLDLSAEVVVILEKIKNELR
jgi:hypothetical protein